MSVTGISFGGLASGLDTGAIIDALVRLERRPIEALRDRKVSFNRKKSLYEDLRSKLEDLQDKAKALRLEGDLLAFKASTNNEGFIGVNTNGKAVPGTYEISVGQLATSEVRTSDGHADKDITQFGEGLLQFTVDGNDHFVTLDSTNNTLEGIANAINSHDGLPVNATVVDTGSGASPYKLVLTSEVEGLDGGMTISTGYPALEGLRDELNDANNLEVTAQNAQLTFNNVQIERSTNTISDLIPGVTIDLIGEHNATDTSTKITISTDAEESATKIKEFVEAYNAVVEFAKAQNKVTQVGNSEDEDGPSTQASPLLGDSALRTIQSSLRSIVGSGVDTGNESYELLVQIGVSSDRDGLLTFSQSDFEEALADDPDAVKSIFAQASTGIANQIYNNIDEWNDSVDGLLQARIDGVGRTTRDIDKQITRLEDRVSAYEERLTRQYSQLETMMNSLNSQSAALSGLGR